MGARFSPSDWLLYGTVALAPLPFGSVDPVWILIWCVLLALSFASADVGGVGRGQLVWLIAPAIAFLAVLIVVALQQHAAFPGIATDRFWQMAATENPAAQPINAATRDPAWRFLGPSLLFTLTFFRAFILATSRERAERLFIVAMTSAAVYALYGLVSTAVEPTMLLGRVKQAYVDSVTGTFVNRNTAATYFGSASILWFLLIARELRRRFGQEAGLKTVLRDLLASGFHRRLALGAVGFGVCLMATLGTGSRAGSFLTLVALVLAGALWAGSMPVRKWILAGSGVALAIGGFIQIWGGAVSYRLQTRSLYDINRAEAYRAVVKIIRDFPWLGIGLGQFEFVFPAYRGDASVTAGVWDKAHSVPLELAAEVGLPAACMVAVAWVACASGMVGGLRRLSAGRMFPIAGLCVGLLATAHAFVDFSLQIPGFAVMFAAVSGASLAQSVRASQSRRKTVQHRSRIHERRAPMRAQPSPFAISQARRSADRDSGSIAR